MKIWIKNGHLIDPGTRRDGIFHLCIEGEKIVSVLDCSQEISPSKEDEVIDAAGKLVMPGFIDLHVHFREPGLEYKETIKTGSMAAARGGFTSVCPMPNTKPVIDSKEMVEKELEIIKRDSIVNVFPVGAVTIGQDGKEVTDIKKMVEAGIMAISEDGKSVMDSSLYRKAMLLAKEAGIPVFAHCEDKALVGKGAVNAGPKAEELGVEGISNAVEDIITARDILLAKETGVQLHLCHCSTKDSVEMVKAAKEQGIRVTAEVCPHHFSMCDEDILSDDSNYKMNPPLRSRADVEALKQGLKCNIMDVIATDHAPHSKEEKDQPISKAPFGIVGLETAYSLTMTELVDKGYLTLMQMVEKMSYNPAKVLGIDRGCLAEGKTADFVIADARIMEKIDADRFHSKGKNTPFHGRLVKGRVEKTFVAGKLVYDRENE